MKLQSLIWNTDLIFTKYEGEILNRQNYIVAKTPSKPNFFWGNFLIFPTAPVQGDFKTWNDLFIKEFTDPRMYHKTFAWDVEEMGDVSEFEAAGYNIEKYVALTTNKELIQYPKKINTDIEIRILDNSEDWTEVVEVQVASARNSLSREQWTGFYQKQALSYQRMITMDLGKWFGAYLDGRLVASLGLFKEGKIGRFQVVSTHPDYQRRGICGTLVYQASQFAFQEMNLETLVMVAFEDYHAAKVYESVGFMPTERMYGACWWDKTR